MITLETERIYLAEDMKEMIRAGEVKEAGDYFAICSNGRAYYAVYSKEYDNIFFCIPDREDILGYVPIKKMKTLKYKGRDSHSRPVYEDMHGKLWKDTDSRKGREKALYSVVNNEIQGEPLWPMKLSIRCEFLPGRIVDL